MCTGGCVYKCGICCLMLSIWAIVQLSLMGIFYKIEATPMIKDVAVKDYTDYDDFIKKTKENYKNSALNCWIGAGVYAVMAAISVVCIIGGGKKVKQAMAAFDDDEIFCAPPEVEPGQQKKGKK
ncbi:ribonuclease kappa-like [Ostrinia furnacalis]|uniref:ribonuclease kappa-like n=1 Tax=Ostrinia furnacalis TaxID=93504 RepID=UPI00103E9DEC|nr:ribonuclease kappa-like [Ostrinia furnacalis]